MSNWTQKADITRAEVEAILKAKFEREEAEAAQHIENLSNALARLHAAIVKHSELTRGEFIDIANHGADAGWSGFCYTSECCDFYDANEEDIYELLNDAADEMGCASVDELVGTFGRKDMLSWPEGRKNLLAWFALEEVARAIEGGSLEMVEDEEAA